MELNRTLVYFAWCFISLGIALSIFNIWTPYSFWLDELYSVTASISTFREMLVLILSDVHPPLYNLILWAWIHLLGDAEPTARLFSLLTALICFVYLTHWSKRFDQMTRLTILLLFSSNSLFATYAQEVRSYSLLMLLTTMLATRFIDYKGTNSEFSILLMLSLLTALTHYFGFILAGLILAWLLFSEFKRPARLTAVVVTGILSFIWPVIQLLYGGLGEKTGGSFWINVDTPFDTLKIAVSGIFTPWELIKRNSILQHTFFAGIILTIILAWTTGVLSKIYQRLIQHNQAAFIRSSLLLLAFLVTISAIDMHTPISTTRNYIAILGLSAIVVGIIYSISVQTFNLATPGLFLLFTVVGINLYCSHQSMTEKWSPLQNWKSSASFLTRQSKPLYYIYFNSELDRHMWMDLVYNYYPQRLTNNNISVQWLPWHQLNTLNSPSSILFGHFNQNTLEKLLPKLPQEKKLSIYQPEQKLNMSTGVISILQTRKAEN